MIKFGVKQTQQKDTMGTHKRINITLHPDDIAKLERISIQRGYTKSGMIARLISDYQE